MKHYRLERYFRKSGAMENGISKKYFDCCARWNRDADEGVQRAARRLQGAGVARIGLG